MIFGIGTDILEISRIDKILKKYNQTFIGRIFGTNEIKIIENKSENIALFLELNKKLIFDISISDEPPYVLAFVVISLAPLV